MFITEDRKDAARIQCTKKWKIPNKLYHTKEKLNLNNIVKHLKIQDIKIFSRSFSSLNESYLDLPSIVSSGKPFLILSCGQSNVYIKYLSDSTWVESPYPFKYQKW